MTTKAAPVMSMSSDYEIANTAKSFFRIVTRSLPCTPPKFRSNSVPLFCFRNSTTLQLPVLSHLWTENSSGNSGITPVVSTCMIEFLYNLFHYAVPSSLVVWPKLEESVFSTHLFHRTDNQIPLSSPSFRLIIIPAASPLRVVQIPRVFHRLSAPKYACKTRTKCLPEDRHQSPNPISIAPTTENWQDHAALCS